MYSPAAPPYAPPPAYSPYPSAKRRRSVPVAVAVGLTVLGAMLGGGVAALITTRHTAAAPPTTTLASTPLTAAQAQAQTCGILKAQYEGVANAVDERNKHNQDPWTDPGLLSSVNTLVDLATRLATDLEKSLLPQTPPELRSAVIDYVAGLRAMSISERNHSKDLQLNGVALFYNQVLDSPLRLCGMR